MKNIGTSVTLYLAGVEISSAPGQFYSDALQDGVAEAAERAFDKAGEISGCLGIGVQH